MTLGAPHLIETLNLTDDDTASWAGAAILGEQLCGRDVLRLTLVRSITIVTLDLVALGAGPLGTEAALPRCAEKAATVAIWTLADECDLGLGLLTVAGAEKPDLILGV